MRLVPALQWTAFTCLAAYLGSHPRANLRAWLVLAAILLIPVFGHFTANLYFQAPYHIPTTLCMLATILLCDRILSRRSRRGDWVIAVGLVAFDAAMSDPFYQFILTLPLAFALLRHWRQGGGWLLALYLGSVALGVGAVYLNAQTGGFAHPTPIPGPTQLKDLPTALRSFFIAWFGILGCLPFGAAPGPMLLAFLRLPLIILTLRALWQALRHLFSLSFIDLCLLLLTLANIAAVTTTNSLIDVTTERYLLPAWVGIAILTARTLRPDRVISVYLAVVSLFSLIGCIAQVLAATGPAPRFSTQETNYIASLEARGLTRGYAGYWQASDTVVATNGAIRVAALNPLNDGRIAPYQWFAKQDWYQGDPTVEKFFISLPVQDKSRATALARFGKPEESFVTKRDAPYEQDIVTYIFSGPLPPLEMRSP